MKPKHWYDETYKMNFYIYYGWKQKHYAEHILQTFGLVKEKFGKGHTMINGEKSIICIWIKNKKDYAVIAHECLHAVNFTFSKIGLTLDADNDEAQAYYLERLYNEVING